MHENETTKKEKKETIESSNEEIVGANYFKDIFLFQPSVTTRGSGSTSDSKKYAAKPLNFGNKRR